MTFNDADLPVPAEIERDLARILARALVQQFRVDAAMLVESVPGSDAAASSADPTSHSDDRSKSE